MNKFIRTGCAVTLLLAAGAGLAAEPAVELAWAALKGHAAQAQRYVTGERITRVYGQPLAFGVSPDAAAEQFRLRHAAVFGVDAVDLTPQGFDEVVGPVQPLLFDPDNGTYRFYLARYTQQKDGIPVFRADLRLLTRNEPDFPVVLAASALRPLGAFIPDRGLLAPPFDPAQHLDRAWERFSAPEPVIWAGVNDATAAPRLAYAVIAEIGVPQAGDHQRWLFVLEAENGQVLFSEDQIVRTDVTGNVSGLATTGPKADFCAPEVSTPMPYAKVTITGGNTAYAGEDGDFVISHGGSDPVTVQSFMTGSFFYVDNAQGPEETLSAIVTPPGPANFTHNAPNNSEYVRAQVNGYIQANIVRDFCLTYNPTYPTVSAQTNFPVYVNRTDVYCPGNAWYDPGEPSVNFCAAGGGNANYAFSNIVHHEYGHHMVRCGGSGQGAYGEGMGDALGVLIADDPVHGYGADGDCNAGHRTADNTCQYDETGCSSCGSEIHDCGQLLSGCIWSTRNELKATHPADYLQILSNLTVNSILLHSGDQITPEITIDFLVLDDDDGNLGNGTPHRAEICAGFGAHNMACPAPWQWIVAWGDNYYGQCNVPAPNSGFVALAGGGYHSLGLKADGSIVAWGCADPYNHGQCNVPAPNTGFVAVAAGGYHSLGLKADGSIVAWGSNSSGECNVPAPNTGFVDVAAGDLHSLGLKADGSIVAWGWNYYGQCNVPAPNTGFVAVAGGGFHSLGLKADGSILAWGANNVGQCNVPAPNTGFVALAAGRLHSLGLKADGSIVAWGYNDYGQCNVPAPNTGFVDVAAGDMHSLGLKADGSIRAWGNNYYGQCNVPAPNSGFVAIAGAWFHSLGLKAFPRGDLNCDGAIDFADIDPFVLALSDPAGYHAAYPNCDILNGDCNGDGQVNFADIDPFVALLTG